MTMASKTHWPFGDASGHGRDLATAGRDWNAAKQREKMSRELAAHMRMRNDRLLVGGRAHTKKPGLS